MVKITLAAKRPLAALSQIPSWTKGRGKEKEGRRMEGKGRGGVWPQLQLLDLPVVGSHIRVTDFS